MPIGQIFSSNHINFDFLQFDIAPPSCYNMSETPRLTTMLQRDLTRQLSQKDHLLETMTEALRHMQMNIALLLDWVEQTQGHEVHCILSLHKSNLREV